MNVSAIVRGTILVILLATVGLLTAWFIGAGKATTPQVITVTALWVLPGFLTGKQVDEAGTLHGLLAGLAGGAVLYLLLPLISGLESAPSFLAPLSTEGRPLLLILAGWWGAFGGLVADNRRLIRARRAARQGRKQND